ncbi:MAG: AAA family ATPase [Pseudomonadota bacterium]
MKLARVKVKNLRCIDELEFFPEDFTTLIGPNNAGKSSVLRAIELFLNQEKPLSDEWHKDKRDVDIEIEADFSDIKDWERDKQGVSGLIHDNKICLRCLYSFEDNKIEATYEAYLPAETIGGWTEEWAGLPDQYRAFATELALNGRNWKTKANQERIKQLIRERLPAEVQTGDPTWTSNGISINAALQQALPQAQLIPANRDASEDGKVGTKSAFGLLLKKIILPAITSSEEYQSLLSAVGVLERRLKGIEVDQLPEVKLLVDSITAKLSELIAAKVTVGMDSPDAEKFIASSASLRLDDGADTRISLKGHGLQRALVFALLETLASQSALQHVEGEDPQSRSTILLFEEPELFIHPHLMRRLKDTLTTISKRDDWQVIATTHSPFMVNVSEPCSLVIHRRADAASPPRNKQLREDPFIEHAGERERLRALLDFHPTVCEAFFAKHVVLVEGDTEIAALTRQPKLLELAGIPEADYKDVTLVSCDGKWTIPSIARLLNRFEIPYRVVHDCDRQDRTDEELEQITPLDPYKANAKIASIVNATNLHVVDDTFEHVLLWDTAPSKDKPYRAWKQIHALCHERTDLTHAPLLLEVLQFVYRPFEEVPLVNRNITA